MANVNLTPRGRYKLGYLRNGTEYLRDTIERLIDGELERQNIDVPPFVPTAEV